MQVYADNAATTRMHQTAIDAMTYHLNNTFGNPSSLYTIGQQAAEKMAAAREVFARNLGAEPREIIFTSGGSEADNQALRSAAVSRKAVRRGFLMGIAPLLFSARGKRLANFLLTRRENYAITIS